VHLFVSGGLNLDFSLIGHALVYIEAAVLARISLQPSRCAAADEGCRVEAQSAKMDFTNSAGKPPLGKPFSATRTPVPARTSQAWLRRFNSAFVSRLGCKH